jgi:hypothetical protein
MVTGKYKLRIIVALILFSSISIVCGGGDLRFGETMEVITKLEKSGEWNKLLPIYRELHGRLRLSFDGLTIPFLFRKGVCELQCSKFDDAEQSFDLITQNGESEKVAEINRVTITRSMFYLADAQARNGKFEVAEKSLIGANRFFGKMVQLRSDPQLVKWRNKIVARIRKNMEP